VQSGRRLFDVGFAAIPLSLGRKLLVSVCNNSQQYAQLRVSDTDRSAQLIILRNSGRHLRGRGSISRSITRRCNAAGGWVAGRARPAIGRSGYSKVYSL
jgi:hypothetical protein